MPNPVTQQERLIARRSKPMERALQRWMLKRAREEAAKQTKALRLKKGGGFTVSKALVRGEPIDVARQKLSNARLRLDGLDWREEWEEEPTREERESAASEVSKAKRNYERVSKAEPIDQELLDILMRFGIAQATGAAGRIGTQGDIKRLVDPKRLKRELQSKDFRLKVFTELERWATKRARGISVDTRKMVKRSIMQILSDAGGEFPQPSAGEMARRIRTQFHGEDPEGRVFAFSPERAALIARTELAQAENTGTANGYEAAGVKKIRWLAKRDGRSGKRHHEKMHNKEVRFGDETFITPLGNRLRWPADPRAPIEDTANCRCAFRAVIVKGDKRQEIGT